MGFFEKMFPGVAGGESEGQEAERLAAQLQSLREQRNNIVLFKDHNDTAVSADHAIMENLDDQIAGVIARLKELNIDIPPDSKVSKN